MPDSDPILTSDQPSLPEALVRKYILDALARGSCYAAQYRANQKKYVITTNNFNEIVLTSLGHHGMWWVSTIDEHGFEDGMQQISSLRELNLEIRKAAKEYGDFWGEEPTAARLKQGQYTSNIGRLASLIGTKQIEAISDPYIENGSLLVLTDMISVGGFPISQDIKLLTTDAKTKGRSPDLTASFAKEWFRERGLPGGKLKITSKVHERFFLLSGNVALVIGCSLNRLTHDETAHLQPDTEHRSTFDTNWATATDFA